MCLYQFYSGMWLTGSQTQTLILIQIKKLYTLVRSYYFIWTEEYSKKEYDNYHSINVRTMMWTFIYGISYYLLKKKTNAFPKLNSHFFERCILLNMYYTRVYKIEVS